MQPGRTTNTGGGTMEVVAAAPRCQLLLIVLMSVMLLPGMKGSPLLVQRTVTRTIRVTRNHRQRLESSERREPPLRKRHQKIVLQYGLDPPLRVPYWAVAFSFRFQAAIGADGDSSYSAVHCVAAKLRCSVG
ncbi:hypothetical protein STEG23_026016 [Scotinomys teguina]